MAILTKSRLSSVTEVKLGDSRYRQTLNEVKNQSKWTATATVFLSHSHSDAALIDKVLVLLGNSGVTVYVDRTDSGLPPTTGPATAARIKGKIKEQKKFILVATDNAIQSKWCNWELGYGDAQKFEQHIALLPLAESSGVWQGSEYLAIYPRIEESYIGSDRYNVIFPDGRTIALSDWLRS
jgi:hypothetical protein